MTEQAKVKKKNGENVLREKKNSNISVILVETKQVWCKLDWEWKL